MYISPKATQPNIVCKYHEASVSFAPIDRHDIHKLYCAQRRDRASSSLVRTRSQVTPIRRICLMNHYYDDRDPIRVYEYGGVLASNKISDWYTIIAICVPF